MQHVYILVKSPVNHSLIGNLFCCLNSWISHQSFKIIPIKIRLVFHKYQAFVSHLLFQIVLSFTCKLILWVTLNLYVYCYLVCRRVSKGVQPRKLICWFSCNSVLFQCFIVNWLVVTVLEMAQKINIKYCWCTVSYILKTTLNYICTK